MPERESNRSVAGTGSFAIPIALVFPVAVAAAGGAVVLVTNNSLPFPGFYELAAQVIPVLMLAFALESRATELLSDPQLRIYRAQLFIFLLGGEVFALLGASGALRGGSHPIRSFNEGLVAGTEGWSNVVAAGTAAGLIGGFGMLAVLALFWGPGWVRLSFGRSSVETDAELVHLEAKVAQLERRLAEAERE